MSWHDLDVTIRRWIQASATVCALGVLAGCSSSDEAAQPSPAKSEPTAGQATQSSVGGHSAEPDNVLWQSTAFARQVMDIARVESGWVVQTENSTIGLDESGQQRWEVADPNNEYAQEVGIVVGDVVLRKTRFRG